MTSFLNREWAKKNLTQTMKHAEDAENLASRNNM